MSNDSTYLLLDAAFRLYDAKMRRDDILGIVADKKAMGATNAQVTKLLSDMADDAINKSQAEIDK